MIMFFYLYYYGYDSGTWHLLQFEKKLTKEARRKHIIRLSLLAKSQKMDLIL